ncbi:MAG: hypothetical protein ACLUKQ_03590 [Peptococcaceae bacterium]
MKSIYIKTDVLKENLQKEGFLGEVSFDELLDKWVQQGRLEKNALGGFYHIEPIAGVPSKCVKLHIDM